MKLSFAGLLVVVFFSAQAQSSSELPTGYYVVVASYRVGQEVYAQAYSSKLNTEGRHSAFGFDPGRKFYHVYLDRYSDFKESLRQMQKARNDGFPTAWVRIMISSGVAASGEPASMQHVDAAPAKTESITANPVVAEVDKKNDRPLVDGKTDTPPQPPAVPADVVATAPPEAEAVAAVVANDPLVHPDLMTKAPVTMVLFNPTNNQEIQGDVEIVEGDKLLIRAKSNVPTVLPEPKGKQLLLKASSFGYRPVQHELNYKATEKDSLPDFVDVDGDHYRIRFEMVRLHRGDIAVLYNVYFYNESAVMIPDSKYELNKLLELMNANTKYRIKLHGHTNGNGIGTIIGLGPSKNFFSLNGDVVRGKGSAKELSRQRAETIRDWLISNNVDADRIEVQAHGGNRMLYDKNSNNAKRNVRVEVEMLSE